MITASPPKRFSELQAIYPSLRGEYWIALTKLIEVLEPARELTSFVDILPLSISEITYVEALNAIGDLGYNIYSTEGKLSAIDFKFFPCLAVSHRGAFVLHRDRGSDGKPNLVAFHCRTGEQGSLVDDGSRYRVYFFLLEEDDENENVTENFAKLEIGWFRTIMDRLERPFLRILLTSLLIGCFSVVNPLFIVFIFGIVASGTSTGLMPFALGAVLAAASDLWVRSLRSRTQNWVSARIGQITGLKLFEKLIWIPPIYTERSSIAVQMSRLKSLDATKDFFRGSVFNALLDVPIALIAFAAAAILGGSLSLIAVGAVAMLAALTVLFHHKIRVHNSVLAKHSTEYSQMIVEFLEKRSSLRVTGMTVVFIERIRELSGKMHGLRKRINFYSASHNALVQLTANSAAALTVLAGIFLVWDKKLEASHIVVMMILVWKVLNPFSQLANTFSKTKQFLANVTQINRLMEIKTEKGQRSSTQIVIRSDSSLVQFVNVGIKHGKDLAPVFTNLNFASKAGELIVISGASGTGKSTLLKLVNGLYRASIGEVLYDGADIRQIPALQLRKRITYIPQNPQFFSGSVLDNLRLGDPLIRWRDIEKVLDQISFVEELARLPQGLDTMLTRELVEEVSDSLLYKIAIARAVISTNKLLLIDAFALSTTSSEMSETLFNLVNKWKGQRTVMLVTNREDLLRIADRVIYLQEKRIPIISSPGNILPLMGQATGGKLAA